MNISMNKSVLRRAAQQMAEQLAAALPEEERTASADGFEAQAAQLLHQEEYRRKGRWVLRPYWRRCWRWEPYWRSVRRHRRQ